MEMEENDDNDDDDDDMVMMMVMVTTTTATTTMKMMMMTMMTRASPGDGSSGDSIYGGKFNDEKPGLKVCGCPFLTSPGVHHAKPTTRKHR